MKRRARVPGLVLSAKKAPRKKAAKKATKKTARKSAKKAARTKAAPPKRAVAKKGGAASAAEARKREPPAGGKRSERVLIPMGTYSANKDAIKKPLKKEGLKWRFLGPGKGRYEGKDVTAFVQFGDEGADFTLEGTDADAVQRILDAWRDVLGGEAVAEAREAAEEKAEEEAEQEPPEVVAWRAFRPVRQPGEPKSWYEKRLAEWEAQKPPGA